MLREHGQIVKKVQVSTLYHVTFTAFRPQPVAIPLPPQCAHWGTFPSGEGTAPCGRCRPIGATHLPPLNNNLSYNDNLLLFQQGAFTILAGEKDDLLFLSFLL